MSPSMVRTTAGSLNRISAAISTQDLPGSCSGPVLVGASHLLLPGEAEPQWSKPVQLSFPAYHMFY